MKTKTRLSELIIVAKRRLGEDVLKPYSLREVPPIPYCAEEYTSVSSLMTRKALLYPTAWLIGHTDRVNTIRELGSDPVPLILLDLEKEVETAATVVLTIWSALRSHFDLDYSSCLNNLIDSVLWYVPMCGSEQEFIPFLKYQLAYLFAKAEKQVELPERPEWIHHNNGLVLTGFLGKFIQTHCVGRSTKNTEFRVTLLSGVKKGMPQMGDFHLKKNLVAMKGRLTKKAETPSCLIKEIERTTREIFPRGIKYDDWNHAEAWTGVSDHASYEITRSHGGVLHHLRLLDLGEHPCGDLPENGEAREEESRTLSRELESLHLLPDSLASMVWNPMTGATFDLRWPDWTVEQVYNSLQRFSVLSYIGHRGKASAKPIYEPFKIRMISAQDILTNGLFSNLQKLLWKSLQKFEQFCLTGKSVRCDDLRWVDRKSYDINQKLKAWVSGDYSAATDNLNADCSLAVVSALSRDPETYGVLKRGLMGTKMDFGSIILDDKPDPFVMTNGQLMGCVFSFPILCIINLAVYRASLEAYDGQKYRISELPVLVNGDDILFKTNSSHYEIWCGLIKKVGFEKSIGKNYVSPDFAMINSTYFRMSKNGIEKVPYLNIGWCTGVTKGGGGGKVKGEEEDEKSILRLRSQVDKTRDEWLREEDSSRGPDHYNRRAEIFERFRDEIHLWNWDRIIESRVSVGNGPAGLGLKDEVEPVYDAFSYYLYNEKERATMHGISSQPKSMSPWKVTKSAFKLEDFRPIWRKFLKAGGVKLWERHAQRYLEQGFDTVRRDFMETRYSVGAFPRCRPGLGDHQVFLMIKELDGLHDRPAWTGVDEVEAVRKVPEFEDLQTIFDCVSPYPDLHEIEIEEVLKIWFRMEGFDKTS